MTVEVIRSQDLQSDSASHRPRRASGLVPVQVRRLENQGSQQTNSHWEMSLEAEESFITKKT